MIKFTTNGLQLSHAYDKEMLLEFDLLNSNCHSGVPTGHRE
jgi:hypothetical protein